MPDDRPTYSVYGLTPDRPVAISLPPVEAMPDQPLPDAGPFLRVCSGAEAPSTAMMRIAVQLVGIWHYTHEQRPKEPEALARLNEQLNLAIWLIDREAGGHVKNVVPQADAPLAPSSYGQWAAWLIWKYLLYALRQDAAEYQERDAAELLRCVQSFDALVDSVQRGRLRLPAEATDVFPPRMVAHEPGGSS
ncbi:hypothetical protein [Nocardia sp. alder85J]|uniref:hypothetical protein n=1 Tax=Nocardia sp. alder85J TaxID=2862949 RepID=UPI001CD665C1|nr:hypothetical protein [Nocardia sp. alder85J]MCX4097394.1 hypothetical protein [Nocardia sp. alder85J]